MAAKHGCGCGECIEEFEDTIASLDVNLVLALDLIEAAKKELESKQDCAVLLYRIDEFLKLNGRLE